MGSTKEKRIRYVVWNKSFSRMCIRNESKTNLKYHEIL